MEITPFTTVFLPLIVIWSEQSVVLFLDYNLDYWNNLASLACELVSIVCVSWLVLCRECLVSLISDHVATLTKSPPFSHDRLSLRRPRTPSLPTDLTFTVSRCLSLSVVSVSIGCYPDNICPWERPPIVNSCCSSSLRNIDLSAALSLSLSSPAVRRHIDNFFADLIKPERNLRFLQPTSHFNCYHEIFTAIEFKPFHATTSSVSSRLMSWYAGSVTVDRAVSPRIGILSVILPD